VKWELVFDPMSADDDESASLQDPPLLDTFDPAPRPPPPPPPPHPPSSLSPSRDDEESFERFFSLGRYMAKRRRANSGSGPRPAATAVRKSSNAAGRTSAVCDCTVNRDPVELSDDHYPSTLPAVACHSGQWCRQTVYPVRVLTRKMTAADELNGGGPGDTAAYVVRDGGGLPYELVRQNWRFVQVDITVACSCSN